MEGENLITHPCLALGRRRRRRQVRAARLFVRVRRMAVTFQLHVTVTAIVFTS